MAKKPDGADVLGARLKALGWTQEKCEIELGLSDGVVSRWLSRKRKPNVTNALRLEAVLDVPAILWAKKPTPDQTRRAKLMAVKVSK